MIGYIYKYTSPSNKSYIGQTRQGIKKRADWTGKAYTRKKNTAFSSAILKYGFENMKLTILHCVEETDLSKLIYILNQLETEEIKAHNTLTPNGYNIESGGKVGAISLETRQKIRESLIGIKHTPERRLKQSLARIGKEPWNKGLKTPFSEVRKQQQSQIGYKSLHERWHVNRNIKKDDCYLC